MNQNDVNSAGEYFNSQPVSIQTSFADFWGFVLTPELLRRFEAELRNRARNLGNGSEIHLNYEIEWLGFNVSRVESVDQLITMENHPRNPVSGLKIICEKQGLQSEPVFTAEFKDPFAHKCDGNKIRNFFKRHELARNPDADPSQILARLEFKSIEIKSDSPAAGWSADMVAWVKQFMVEKTRAPLHKLYFNSEPGLKLDGLLARLQWVLVVMTLFWYIDFNDTLNIKSFWVYDFFGSILFYAFLFRMFMFYLERFYPPYNFVWGAVGRKFEQTEKARKRINRMFYIVGIPLFLIIFFNSIHGLIDPRFLPSWIF
jgi:hypothetical protein